jgi:TfoX/Sxy family transcriptional regulator of competence genes
MKPSDVDTLNENTILYDDDLVIAMKNLQPWIMKVENNLILKLKENGPSEFNFVATVSKMLTTLSAWRQRIILRE